MAATFSRSLTLVENGRFLWNRSSSSGTAPLRFVEATPVETILYCAHTNEPDWEFPKKYIEVLGPNPVQHVVDFARKHQKEFFYPSA